MKKTSLLIFIFSIVLPNVFSQSFSDDFENYNVGDYLGNQGTGWTTWSNSPGTSEDIQIVNDDAFSGSNSIYYDSPYGGGPQDIVLPFNGVHNTGTFKFRSMWKVPYGNSAYFNFQGGASLGSSWALDFYMYDDGSFYVDKLSGYFPQGQWFEIGIDVNFDTNVWEVFIDGVSQGTFSNGVNAVSFLDIFGVNYASQFWIDDVSYCFNNDCKTDLELKTASLSPNPICTNKGSDLTLDLTNHGPDAAKGFNLGLDMVGQGRIGYYVNLNGLAVGADTTIVIPAAFLTHKIVSSMPVKILNVDHDRNRQNDSVYTTITSYASPSGSSLIKGAIFQGKLNVGSPAQPDVVEIGKSVQYELTPPTNYTNSNFGSTWSISSIVARTTYGSIVPPSAYTLTNPLSGNNAVFKFTGLNTYLDSNITISYTISNTPNGCDSTIKRTIRVVPTPKPNFSIQGAVCLGDFTNFDNTTTIHSGTSTYKWYFGDGDSSDNTNPIHEFKTAGSFNVKIVATSFPYDIVKDTTIIVQVSDIPVVKFRPINACEGSTVRFQNQSTISSGTMTYDWDFGDASTHATASNPTHLYAAPGAFVVKLTASANGCLATQTRNAYQFAKPVASYTAPSTSVCALSEITLPNTSTIALGDQGALWDYSDGNISTTKNGKHAFAIAKTYDVKLTAVSEFGCKDSITKQIVVKETPIPAFVGNQFCGKIPTVFTNTTIENAPISTYTWTFSDNYTSNQKNVTRTWPNEGRYNVMLQALYANGCSGVTSKDITVAIQPKANFTAADICSGEILNFVNLTSGDKGNINYSWDFGNGTGTDASPKRLYNPSTTTTYTVSLAASYVNGCSDTVFKTVTVSQAPTCDFSIQNQGFIKYQFTPSNTTYTKYEWYFGEGGASFAKIPTYQYLYAGGFHVKMIATNSAGCNCEITKTISANTSTTSIGNNVGLKIYPNPNSGTFTVSNNNGNSMKIEVYNLLGSKILSQTSADSSVNINLGDVAKGIYLVKVTVNEVTTTTKVTVTN